MCATKVSTVRRRSARRPQLTTATCGFKGDDEDDREGGWGYYAELRLRLGEPLSVERKGRGVEAGERLGDTGRVGDDADF
jgi:hypothetical protein